VISHGQLARSGSVRLNGRVGKPSSTALATGRVGAAAIVFFALAATAPIAVLFNVVPAAYALGGGSTVPLAFVVLGVVLLFFSAGYAAMAHRAPFAGAMYSYVARGLGRPAGAGAAWVALAAYHAVQLGLYGVAGAAAAPLLQAWFDLTVPWWGVAGVCWALVALCGPIRIEIGSGLIALLVLGEAAVAAGFTAANVIKPSSAGFPSGSIVPDLSAIDRPALGLLLAVGVLAFIGFETTGTYAEESMRPRREPGHATYTTVAVVAFLLAAASWSLAVAAGPDRIAAMAGARGTETVFDLAAARLTPWAVTLGRLMLLTGLFAAMLALHHALNRYLYALGRERILPAALGRTSPRTGAPRTASIVQSLVAGVLLGAAYLVGVGEPASLARGLSVAGGLGILLLLLATSVATLLHLNQVPGNEGAWARFVAPILSTVALGSLAWLVGRNLPALLVVPEGSAWRWIVPGAVAGVAVLGALHALVLRRLRPVIYAGLGQGGIPVVVTPKIPSQRRSREPGAHRPERIKGHAA
jgi:amino acid transporter